MARSHYRTSLRCQWTNNQICCRLNPCHPSRNHVPIHLALLRLLVLRCEPKPLPWKSLAHREQKNRQLLLNPQPQPFLQYLRQAQANLQLHQLRRAERRLFLLQIPVDRKLRNAEQSLNQAVHRIFLIGWSESWPKGVLSSLSAITLSDGAWYRIFMIDRNRIPGQLSEQFSVLGSTGNVSDLRHRQRSALKS